MIALCLTLLSLLSSPSSAGNRLTTSNIIFEGLGVKIFNVGVNSYGAIEVEAYLDQKNLLIAKGTLRNIPARRMVKGETTSDEMPLQAFLIGEKFLLLGTDNNARNERNIFLADVPNIEHFRSKYLSEFHVTAITSEQDKNSKMFFFYEPLVTGHNLYHYVIYISQDADPQEGDNRWIVRVSRRNPFIDRDILAPTWDSLPVSERLKQIPTGDRLAHFLDFGDVPFVVFNGNTAGNDTSGKRGARITSRRFFLDLQNRSEALESKNAGRLARLYEQIENDSSLHEIDGYPGYFLLVHMQTGFVAIIRETSVAEKTLNLLRKKDPGFEYFISRKHVPSTDFSPFATVNKRPHIGENEVVTVLAPRNITSSDLARNGRRQIDSLFTQLFQLQNESNRPQQNRRDSFDDSDNQLKLNEFDVKVDGSLLTIQMYSQNPQVFVLPSGEPKVSGATGTTQDERCKSLFL